MVVPATLTGQAGADRRLAREIAARRALLHGAAENDILDLGGIDLGAPRGVLEARARASVGAVRCR